MSGEAPAPLAVSGLAVVFPTETGEVRAVEDVSLELAAGETLALVGESGSGKSTVALSVLGLVGSRARITGRVAVDGVDVAQLDERRLSELRGGRVGMVFQEPATALDPLAKVGDQIAEVLRNHRELSRADARREAVELLARVGIPDPARRARAFPFQLSGGQRQRVVIAMAIANRPALLVADEPTTALDVTVQAEILELLRSLAAETDTAVLLVTHNMGVVADFADRVAVMRRGRLLETGPVERVLVEPEHEYTRALLDAVPRLRLAADPPDPARVGARTPGIEASRADDPPALRLDGVDVVFGRGRRAVRALEGVDLAVPAGATVGLVGESGSGKSTAARVALGLIRPDAGGVSLLGRDLTRIRGAERRRLLGGIGVVLQDPGASLDPRMSVGECVAEPLRVHERGLSRDERRDRVLAALDSVRLEPALARRSPGELSGGQRQRVSLARALVLGPRLLVADEPTSALDVSVQRSVLEVIRSLQDRLGFACLFVSHDLAVVQGFADDVVVMRRGRVVESGPTDRTLLEPDSDYTRRLLAAVPVPDPAVQRRRRSERLAALAAGEDDG